MSPFSIRFTNDEKEMLQSFSEFKGMTITATIKQIIFERLEDEYDMHLVDEYRKNTKGKSYSPKETSELLGIADEV
jgi:predicted DNA-binding protein